MFGFIKTILAITIVIAIIGFIFGFGFKQNLTLNLINEPWAESAQSNPSGEIIVIEFLDYSCGYCKNFHPIIQTATQYDPKINLIIRPVGLLGEDSTKMARLIIAAGLQNKAMELHRYIMSQRSSPNANMILNGAKNLGLDVNKMRVDSESEETMKILKINEALFRLKKIRGVPALLVNGEDYNLTSAKDPKTLNILIHSKTQ